jgi:hypothetical protein
VIVGVSEVGQVSVQQPVPVEAWVTISSPIAR